MATASGSTSPGGPWTCWSTTTSWPAAARAGPRRRRGTPPACWPSTPSSSAPRPRGRSAAERPTPQGGVRGGSVPPPGRDPPGGVTGPAPRLITLGEGADGRRVTKRSWHLLLACAALGAAGCALGAVVPGTGVGDAVVFAGTLVCSTLLWVVGGRRSRQLRGWRLLALGLPLPGVGMALGYLLHPAASAELVALRWLTTVPGFGLATLAVLTLV